TSNAQDACKADAPKSSGNSNPTATSTNPPADQMETRTVETPIPTVSSPVPTACLDDSPQLSSDTRLISKRVTSQDDTPSLDNILTLSNRFEYILGVTTNTGDTNGVEADLSNMENNISASPTLTFIIHEDHPTSQIIGLVDTLVQTKTKSKETEEQSFIASIHHKTNPDLLQFCLFSCFLSQEEPKMIFDALKDPNWMDVKSAFLYGTIDEEVYVMKPPGFQDLEFPARVYKVEKAINSIMARLAFYDYHNMIAILEKYEHNVDFHPIVDFVEASHIRIETTDEGTKILAIVDSKPRTISESSIRRNLKLKDEAGISSLPDAELFENLALMGPRFSSRTVPLFDSMLVHQGEGSGTPTEPHHTPSPEAPQSPQHDLSSSTLPPSLALLTAVDEPASPLGDDSQGKACPTVSGLEAEQDRANIINMKQQLNEFTDLCTLLQRQQTEMAAKTTAQDLEIASLKAKIKMLEDKDGGGDEPSGEDATIKGRSLETGEEAGVDKSTERGKVATVSVPTGSGMVPTASPIFTTASVVTPYSRRKGKEKMVESDTSKKKKLQEQIDVQVVREMEEQMAREDQRRSEQIARDAEIARIYAEEELQMLINGLERNNEYQAQQSKPLSKKQQREFYMSVLKSHSGWKTKHFKGMSLEEIREKFIPVWNQIEDFVLMDSKEEGERFKRKGLRLEQSSAKKMKAAKDVSKEDLQIMMQLVPVEEVYVEALQVKHPIIDWEIHTKGQRNYWKVIRLGGSTAVYQLFVDMLKHFDKEDLNQLWTLTQTQALMHDPVEWRLYDTCGVHHVLSKDQEIFIDEFPLPEDFLTASEERFPLLSQKDATAEEVCTADEVKERQLLKQRVQDSLSYKRSP
nr:ribonuclease H-like domain, reverse transcriptase, RNA-dependent DNA polymerase [Tanacetum cinerariifolium]